MNETKEKLVREFEELKAVETHAYNLYVTLMPYISGSADRKTIQGIIDDETNHAKIAQKIIDIIKE